MGEPGRSVELTPGPVLGVFESACEDIESAVDLELAEDFRRVLARYGGLLRTAAAARGVGLSRAGVAELYYAAADAHMVEVGAGDTGLRDALNLLGNAALTYIDDPEAEFSDIGARCYSKDLSVVLGWIDG